MKGFRPSSWTGLSWKSRIESFTCSMRLRTTRWMVYSLLIDATRGRGRGKKYSVTWLGGCSLEVAEGLFGGFHRMEEGDAMKPPSVAR